MLEGTDNTRDRILEAAHRRFFVEGFARVSIDEISAEISMSKKTFYKHFSGKDDLVRLIMERFLRDVSTNIQNIVDAPDPFPQKLDNLARFIGNRFRTIHKPMLGDLQKHMPGLWEHIQAFRRERITTIWTGLIEEGKRDGSVRPDVNTRIFLLAVIAALDGVIHPAVLVNESCSADEALREIINMFFQGILTGDALQEYRHFHQVH
jgi:AcrR family transcriptional regulator